MYRVYLVNFDFHLDYITDSYSEAEAKGRSTGFEFVVTTL